MSSERSQRRVQIRNRSCGILFGALIIITKAQAKGRGESEMKCPGRGLDWYCHYVEEGLLWVECKLGKAVLLLNGNMGLHLAFFCHHHYHQAKLSLILYIFCFSCVCNQLDL